MFAACAPTKAWVMVCTLRDCAAGATSAAAGARRRARAQYIIVNKDFVMATSSGISRQRNVPKCKVAVPPRRGVIRPGGR